MRNKMFKRIITLILTGAMLTGLVACGASEAAPAEVAAPQAEEAATKEETADAEAEEEIEEVSEKPYEVNVNLIANGGFDDGLAGWSLYTAKGGVAEFANVDGECVLTIKNSGAVNYAVQPYYDGFALLYGGIYEFSFDMSSTVPRNLESRIQVNGGDYHAYVLNYYDITESMETYTCTFRMEESNDPAPRICLNLGTPDGESNIGEHEIHIDNVSLKIIDDTDIVVEEVVDNTIDVNCNQVGFLPKARKTAVSKVSKAGDAYDIVDADNGSVVYSGTFEKVVDSEAAAESLAQAVFTDFDKEGTYKIVLSGGEESYPFTIASDVYDTLLSDSFKFFYSQRCGEELDSAIVGDFAHPACHTSDAIIYGSDATKTVLGGWHDAGDYGRYTVPGAVAAADLMLAYEDAPEIWDNDNTGIPESGNGVPDILDEVRYELEYLMMMQDEATGGVYHKISCKEFPEFIMPEEETEDLYLAPISHTATGDLAAVLAKASVLYRDFDSAFADKCLKMAKKSWDYLEADPATKGFKNPEDILTGEYPDNKDGDERYWAAVELYNATGDAKYEEFIEEKINVGISHGYGWALVSSYGNMAYIGMDESKTNPDVVAAIKDSVVEQADNYVANVLSDGYMCDLGTNYVWGSNMNVSNNARMMIDAYKLTGDEKYEQAAYDQLSYLLGQNAVSYCFLSGYGTISPVNAHHRPSMATNYVLSGMVIGGPNKNLEDPYAKATLLEMPPAKCYADNAQAFSLNEVAIYWNSPFVYLLGYEMNANK